MKYLTLSCFIFFMSGLYGQTTDANGKKQGYWKKRDDKNHLLYEGEFKDDKPVGKFKYYYPNDSVRAIMTFKDEGRSAYARLFHMNGKRMAEGKYINKEIKDSVWTYYDELGTLLSKDTYKNGKKNGLSYVYFPEGDVSEQRNYKDDLEDGSFVDYFDAKAVKSRRTYIKGKLEGRVSYYYPNGVEVAAGYYKNGEKNGPWIYKTQSGKIREKELYKNGILASPKETEAFFSKNKVEEKKPEPAKPPTTTTGKKPG
ncbi:MAG: toxin-antitoxin system YwqK family antitoxin [Bacteroidia bacterium]|nr:toxin-antitoxin system YwqK family antitoxin [Bacteroidia bacterium]